MKLWNLPCGWASIRGMLTRWCVALWCCPTAPESQSGFWLWLLAIRPRGGILHGCGRRLRLGQARLGAQLPGDLLGARLYGYVVAEQAQQQRVACRRTRHGLGETVEAFQLGGAASVVGLRLGLRAELAGHGRHRLERRQRGRGDPAFVDRRRNPPPRVGQGRDPALVVAAPRCAASGRAGLLGGGLPAPRAGAARAATARSRWHSHSPWVDCTML